MADIKVGDEAAYAASVVQVLREHLPDFDPEAADNAADAVERNARRPGTLLELIVDNPRSARWRLKACSVDHGRVRLAYYPVLPPGSVAGNEVERTVNDALRALETEQ